MLNQGRINVLAAASYPWTALYKRRCAANSDCLRPVNVIHTKHAIKVRTQRKYRSTAAGMRLLARAGDGVSAARFAVGSYFVLARPEPMHSMWDRLSEQELAVNAENNM